MEIKANYNIRLSILLDKVLDPLDVENALQNLLSATSIRGAIVITSTADCQSVSFVKESSDV